jgi:hypothetical protein
MAARIEQVRIEQKDIITLREHEQADVDREMARLTDVLKLTDQLQERASALLEPEMSRVITDIAVLVPGVDTHFYDAIERMNDSSVQCASSCRYVLDLVLTKLLDGNRREPPIRTDVKEWDDTIFDKMKLLEMRGIDETVIGPMHKLRKLCNELRYPDRAKESNEPRSKDSKKCVELLTQVCREVLNARLLSPDL